MWMSKMMRHRSADFSRLMAANEVADLRRL